MNGVLRRGIAGFAKDVYPQLKRGPYAVLTDHHLQSFESILGSTKVLTDESDLEGYNTDWFGAFRGCGRVVLRPSNAHEVSEVLKICYENRLAVVPQGGNTGLVYGSVPIFDEIIISTSLMKTIREIDQISGTVSCDAGCVHAAVSDALEEHALMLPYDLGSKGSCQIGGNVSTSAGGLKLIRYGSMQANTLGLEVVLSDGRILDLMTGLRKDNTGYHLRQAFIGAEGTLGIVTGAVIQCPPLPVHVALAFLGVEDYSKVLEVMGEGRRHLGECVSSVEMVDRVTAREVDQKLGLRNPLGLEHPLYMTLEVQSGRFGALEALESLIERLLERNVIRDAIVSSQPSTMRDIWKLRERAVEAEKLCGHLYTYDLTLPLADVYSVVPATREFLKGTSAVFVSGYGHVGDGNIHLNVITEVYDGELEKRLERFVYEWVMSKRGSISAEHGVGRKKADYLVGLGKPGPCVDAMFAIKRALDPRAILNPYKLFPQTFSSTV